MNAIDSRLTALMDWIRRTTDGTAGRGVLVPVSGGSDSALCFWLCTQALPPGRAVAAYSGTRLRCSAWFESLGPVHLLAAPPPSNDPEVFRWTLMLREARQVRGWLVGTRNRTEDVLGTYSLASRLATYLPLVSLWKSEVMELAARVGVPDEILRSSLRADPLCGRPKEMADIPFEMVDLFLQVKLGIKPDSELSAIAPLQLEYLKGLLRRNRFKQELPLRPDC